MILAKLLYVDSYMFILYILVVWCARTVGRGSARGLGAVGCGGGGDPGVQDQQSNIRAQRSFASVTQLGSWLELGSTASGAA